jgi:serine/threonine protein kinase
MVGKEEDSRSLKIGTQVADYQIIRVLGQGAFGITYLATDLNLQIRVAIKEYFPREFSVRSSRNTVIPSGSRDDKDYFEWGRDRFLSEARILARLDHPNIVAVRRLLEANQTAYLVMDYCEGRPLDEIIESDGPLSASAFEKLLWPILDALNHVHRAGLIHRDVKPANIFVRSDGSPVLLDFGAAKNDISQHSRSVTSLATAGYAPLEQYDTRGNQGPWSDIYGFSATLYRALTGERPPDAAGRVLKDSLEPLSKKLDAKLDRNFLLAIDKGLEVLPDERPQSVEAWRSMFGGVSPPLNDAGVGQAKPTPVSKGATANPTPNLGSLREGDGGKGLLLWSITLLVLVGILFWISQRPDSSETTSNVEIKAIDVAATAAPGGSKDEGEKIRENLDTEKVAGANRQESGPAQIAECPANIKSTLWTDCKGEMAAPDGSFYSGTFKDGRYHGVGTLTYKGDRYVGRFKDHKYHGKGSYTYADGSNYVGEWKEGRMTGRAVFSYANGDKYVGGFLDDKYHGQGKYTNKEGQTFEGNYVQDKRVGKGIIRFPDGETQESFYVDDKATNPITVRFSRGDTYIGDVNPETNRWQGRGTYSFKDGRRFVGEYRDGKRNGFGTMYRADGTIDQNGIWRDDEFISSTSGSAPPQSNSSDSSTAPHYARPIPVIAPRASNAETLRLCEAEADATNKTLPSKPDLVTTYTNTSCKETARGVILIARHEFSGELPRGSLTEQKQVELKKNLVQRWCSDPKLKPYLSSVSIEYQYYDNSKSLGMVVLIEARDCR